MPKGYLIFRLSSMRDGRDTLALFQTRYPLGEPRFADVQKLANRNGYEITMMLGPWTRELRDQWPLSATVYTSWRHDGVGRSGGQFYSYPARESVGSMNRSKSTPPMNAKPSKTQLEVIQEMVKPVADGRIHHQRGGFWTTNGMTTNGRGNPDWSVTIQTIRAMEARGWLRRRNVSTHEWQDERELTDAGRALAVRNDPQAVSEVERPQ